MSHGLEHVRPGLRVLGGQSFGFRIGHVARTGGAEALRKNLTGERLDLGHAGALPPERMPRHARGLDAGADA